MIQITIPFKSVNIEGKTDFEKETSSLPLAILHLEPPFPFTQLSSFRKKQIPQIYLLSNQSVIPS
jgi:hypothetical protein